MNVELENIIKNTPLPVAGLAFGITGLGGLFAEFGQGYWAKPLFATLDFSVLMIALLKIIYFHSMAKDNLKHPIQAAVAPIIALTLILDAGYLSEPFPTFSFMLWTISAIAFFAYVVWFVWKYILHFELKNVFAAFFIPFVGFCVPVMTSHHLAEYFSMLNPLREYLFLFASILFGLVFLLISWRYIQLPVEENAAKPVFAIYTAPLAMLIVGYVRLPIEHSATSLTIAILLSQALFLMVLRQIPTILKNGFFPSYAALTFPFIITANSLWECLPIFGNPLLLTILAWIETLLAITLTAFVCYKYTRFFYKTAKGK